MSNHYTYRAEWSPEDEEYVGLVAEFPSLSWLAPTAAEAVAGASDLVDGILADMAETGETPPAPLTERRYSGSLSFRTSPAQHRQLAIEAAEQGVSVNQLLVYKTALRAAQLAEPCKDEPAASSSAHPSDGDHLVVQHVVKVEESADKTDLHSWNTLPESVRTGITKAVQAAVLPIIPPEMTVANMVLNSPEVKATMAEFMKNSGVLESIQENARSIVGVPNLDKIIGPRTPSK